MFEWLWQFKERIFETEDTGPEEDVHQDEGANIGDERYFIRPGGELWGYDKEHHMEKIEIIRQKYQKNATFNNGKKSYGWMSSETIFRGTVED